MKSRDLVVSLVFIIAMTNISHANENVHDFSSATIAIEEILSNCNRPEIYDNASTTHSQWADCFRACERSLNEVKKLLFTHVNNNSTKFDLDGSYNDSVTVYYNKCKGAYAEAQKSDIMILKKIDDQHKKSTFTYTINQLIESSISGTLYAANQLIGTIQETTCRLTNYVCDKGNDMANR